MADRALEWMRFNPVKFGLLATDLGPEGEGYLIRLVRHLWERGPMSVEDARRVAGRSADDILPLMIGVGDRVSLELVEEARMHGKQVSAQRSKAGQASAAKRNERSTPVEQPLELSQHPFNDSSTPVLSRSMSQSPSESNNSGMERARTELVTMGEASSSVWPTFEDFWNAYDVKVGRYRAEREWTEIKDQAVREAIMRHVPLYKANNGKFKNPDNYLKELTWQDAIINRNGNGSPTQQSTTEKFVGAMRLLEAERHRLDPAADDADGRADG